MNNRQLILLAILCMLSAGNSTKAIFAATINPESASGDFPTAQFLLINPSAKSLGMGGAYAALPEDSAGVITNAAAGVFIPNSEIYIGNSSLPEIELDLSRFIGFTSKSRSGDFGWSIFMQIQDSGNIDSYDYLGNKTGTVNELNRAYGINLSFSIINTIALGVTGKIIDMSMAGDGYNILGIGFASDIGIIYKSLSDRFSMGLALNNFGGQIGRTMEFDVYKFNGTKESLPKSMKMGFGFKFLDKKNLVLLTDIGNEGISPSDYKWNIGMEYSPVSMVSFRSGISGSNGLAYLMCPSFGLGIKLSGLVLDYAAEMSESLGNKNSFAVRYCFASKPAEEKQAVDAEQEMNKAKKAVEWEESGQIPEEKPIIRYRKDSREKQKILEQPEEIQQLVLPVKKSEDRMNIAIAEFSGRNVSSMEAAIVSDFLRGELVKSEQFTVLDRQNMEKVLNEQKFQLNECTTEECAVQMGRLLNVKKIVSGSLSKLLDKYYITINIIDVETGKIEYADKDSATNADEISTACERLAYRIANKYK